MDHRKRDGHSYLPDLKDPRTHVENLVYSGPGIAHCVDQSCTLTDPRSPLPGVLGHRDSVRGRPGCVCDAQPGLALAAHPLSCPTPPLCGPVFCRYPLRDLSLCFWSLAIHCISVGRVWRRTPKPCLRLFLLIKFSKTDLPCIHWIFLSFFFFNHALHSSVPRSFQESLMPPPWPRISTVVNGNIYFGLFR